jgi:NhaP-type Na+/H+ or K+/H+ antiporter
VLAAVTTGLYAGRYAEDISTPESRLRIEPVWDAATFILESILFLLIGLQLPTIVRGIKHGQTVTAGLTALAAVATLMALRWLWIACVSPLFARVPPAYAATSWREVLVLSWSGMRGALSLAGALSIPLLAGARAFPARDEVIFLVYCVVLGTLIVPSFTLRGLLRRLGLAQDDRLRDQELQVRAQIAHAALAQLERLAGEREISDELLAQLRGIYSLRLSRLESTRREAPDVGATNGEHVHEIRAQLVEAQRRALAELRAERAVGTEVLSRIQRDIDLDETRLRSGH